MVSNTKLSRLPALIKAKRRKDRVGLREAADISGVSPSTLSRLERGISSSLPDTDTLTKIANWLNISLEEILHQKKTSKTSADLGLSTPEAVEIHLRADKNLTPETAKALSDMFGIIYKEFMERGKTRK